MKSDILSLTDLAVLPELSLFIFLAVFAGAVAWIYRPGSRQAYARRAQLALDDDNIIEPREV